MIASFLRELEQVFGGLLAASWQASVLALFVLLIQWGLVTRLNPRWRYALWLLVLLRLVLPVQPESALSLFQFAPTPAALTVSVTEPLFVSAPPPPLPSIPSEVAEPARAISIYSLLAVIWLAGAIFLFVLTWMVNRRFLRQVANSPAIADPELLRLFAEAKSELGTRRAIRLIENAQVRSPAIMGLFQPTLLLPVDVRQKFDTRELRFIFLHELAHLKRGDVAIQTLIALLQILHWFNPVLWYAFRRMRVDREPATDALVLSRTGEEEKERYGLMLIKLLEHFNQRHSLPTLVGILEDKDQFKRRFSLIARFTRGAYGWSLLGVLLIAILAVVGLTRSKGEDSPKAAATTPEAEAKQKGIAAIVNGKPVYWWQINYARLVTPSAAREKAIALQEGIDNELMVQAADASELALADDSVRDKLDFDIKGFGGNKSAFEENLEKNGQTLEQFTEMVRRQGILTLFISKHFADPARAYADSQFPASAPASNSSVTKLDVAQLQRGASDVAKLWQQAFQTRMMQLNNDWLEAARSKASIQTFENSQAGVQQSDAATPASPSATPTKTNTAYTNQVTTDAAGKNPRVMIRIATKVVQINEADYQAHLEDIDAAVRRGDVTPLTNLQSFDWLSEPTVLTKSGERGVLEAVRVFPYPIAFKKEADGKFTPTDFTRQNLGMQFVVSPTFVDGKINFKGDLNITSLEGWTQATDSTYRPNFHVRELPVSELFASGQTKGFEMPGGAQMELADPTAVYFAPGQPPNASQNPKALRRIFLFLSAQALHEDSRSMTDPPIENAPAGTSTTTGPLTVRAFLAPAGFFKTTPADHADVRPELIAHGIAFPVNSTAIYVSIGTIDLAPAGKIIVRNTPEQLDKLAALIEAASNASALKTQGTNAPFDPSSTFAEGGGLNKPITLSIIKPKPDRYGWASAYQQVAAKPPLPSLTGHDHISPPNDPSKDLDTLKKDLLMAEEDADARRVLVNSVKDLSDDQFLATLAGLGRSDTHISALQKEIADKNAEIAGLLSSGLTESHSRVATQRAELASLQQELKHLTDGLHNAMTIDSQMADSRVELLTKEIGEGFSSAAAAASAAPSITSTVPVSPSPVKASTDQGNGQIQIGLKVIEISDDVYLANKAKVDAAVDKADIGFFNTMEGASLLSTPSVSTQPGQKANIEIVREFPYPIKFDPAERVSKSGGATVTVPMTPTDFVTKDIGVSAEITPSIDEGNSPDHGKIILNGKFSVTDFEGFTKSNLVGTGMPSFSTCESLFIEALDDNQEKGVWIPGDRVDEQTITDKDNLGKIVSEKKETVKKRLLLFLNARRVKSSE